GELLRRAKEVDGQVGHWLIGAVPRNEFRDDALARFTQEVDQRKDASFEKPAADAVPKNRASAVDDDHRDAVAGDVQRGGSGYGDAQVALRDQAVEFVHGIANEAGFGG